MSVVVQFDLSSRASILCAARDLGEPCELSRSARQNNRCVWLASLSNCTTTQMFESNEDGRVAPPHMVLLKAES
jgi:hypothetical protein